MKPIKEDWYESVFQIEENPLTEKLKDGVRRNVIFTVTGASGVGKDRIFNSIIEWSEIYIKPVSFTTRKQRLWEVPWKDYYFTSVEEFEKLKEAWEIFEYTTVSANFYGYTNMEMKRIFETWKIPICIVDEVWARCIWENLGGDFEVFKIFVLPPTAMELKKRLVWRDGRWEGYKDGSGKKQPTAAIKRFSESKHWIRRAKDGTIKYDGFLVNNDLDGAVRLVRRVFEDILNGTLTE